MEEAVQTDAGVAVELTAQRERQTERSLHRASRNLSYGYLLMASAAIFLICANWRRSFETETPVSMAESLRSRPEFAVFPEGLVSLEGDRRDQLPDVIDLAFVDEVIAREGRGKDAAIPLLRAIQTHYGYLPDEALRKVCEETEITPAQIAGTSTFYSQFRLSPVGKHIVKLCHGTACHVSGIGQITDELRRRLSIEPGDDTDPSRLFTLEKVACLGCCSLAPVMMIDEETVGRLTPASACQALHDFSRKRPE
jgi:NADH:ubiquinone oxidoreductase subunit E